MRAPSISLILFSSLSLSLMAQERPGREGRDHFEQRREAELLWSGGAASPNYLDFKARAAARVLEAEGLRPLRAGSEGPAWINLGPFTQRVVPALPDNDGGRATAILTHPSDPKILYLATQSGLFKCTNADVASEAPWIWTSIGDTLPSNSSMGNLSIGALGLDPSNPNRIFAGMGDPFGPDAKGFFISGDGGLTWSAGGTLGNATKTLDIFALNATTILVGTNAGLWRSTNGGASFTNIPLSGSGSGNAWSIKAFSATELLCSRNGLLFYSSDGGGTWSPAVMDFSVTALGPSRITLAISPSNVSQAWATCDSGGKVARGLLKTTDKGHSWTYLPAPTQVGGLFQGKGWNGDPTNPGQPDMPYDGEQGTYNQLLAVDPSDINKLYLGANLALYRTVDGGLNWSQVTHWAGFTHLYHHADFHASVWSQVGPKILYLGSDGGLGVLKQPDLAQFPSLDWDQKVTSNPSILDHRRNAGLASQLIYNLGSTLAASPADSRYRITAGLQDNGVIVRHNDGAGMQNSSSFPEASQPNGESLAGDGFGTVIHSVNGDLMLGAEQFDFIFKTVDGGATWNTSYSGIAEAGDGNAAPFYAKLVLGLADPTGNTVYTTARQKVYKSTDFGGHWVPMGTSGYGGQSIRNVAASNRDANAVAIVTSSSTGFITTDGGSTWTPFGAFPTADAGSGVRGSFVWFDTENASMLYAAASTFTATGNHVWRSTNHGQSWTALDSSTNGYPYGIPAQVIQNAPGNSNELYVGTDLGLWRSTDGGISWVRFGTGLPLVGVRDLYLAPDHSFIRAATWGRGIWELSLGAAPVGVAVNPGNAELKVGTTQAFSATVTGSADTSVLWSIQEAPNGGTISASGLYSPPSKPGTFHVIATSVAAPAVKATVGVKVFGSADLDGNQIVDVLDLALLARAFGATGLNAADLDGNGTVDDADIPYFLRQM